MARADHQPREKAPERRRRTAEELRAALGRTVTFVLALGDQGQMPDIRPTNGPQRGIDARPANDLKQASETHPANSPKQVFESRPADGPERVSETHLANGSRQASETHPADGLEQASESHLAAGSERGSVVHSADGLKRVSGIRPAGGPGQALGIRPAAEAALIAQVPAVFVLASPARAREATEVVRLLPRKGRTTMVQAVEFDTRAALDSTRAAGDFELFGLPFGLLEAMRAVAGSVLDDYDGILVLDGAQSRITPEHLCEIALDVRRDPGIDVVASWIEQLRRPPYLIARTFLEELEERGLTQADEGAGKGKAPLIRTFDHVFEGELLAAPTRTPARAAHFLDRCSMSALQAVQLAKYAKEHPGEERRPPDQTPKPRDAATPGPLGSPGQISDSQDGAIPESPGTPGSRDAAAPGLFSSTDAPQEPSSPGQTPDSRNAATPGPLSSTDVPRQPRSPGWALASRDVAIRSPLSSADALLVQVAGQVAERGRADARAAGDAIELAWADAFGRRNKLDFPLLNDRAHAGRLAYLDSAATAQRVGAALAAQREFDEHANANVYRGAYELSAGATSALDDARARIEGFIGATRRQTVLCANATAAINLVAQAWGEHHIGEDDLIVMELAGHHSNLLPFAMLAERKGARVEYLPYDRHGRIDRRELDVVLRQRPKLVCLAHIGNVFGIEAPVAEIAARAHEAGAHVLVDAAQSFPHVKLDVGELGADWLAFSGHKAYGPLGIGGLWISDAAFAEMDPLGGGGGAVSHVSTDSYRLRPEALQYEMGTLPISQAIGLAAALDYLDGLGMDNVRRHAAALTRYLVRGLSRIDGVTVIGDHSDADGQGGLVSFTVRGVMPAELAGFLGGLDVAIRAGGHCALPLHASLGLVGTGRVSIAVHTTRDDLDAALAAIELCRRAYEG